MNINVAKWGNSLAVRIPTAFAREIDVDVGAPVNISVADGAIVLRPVEESHVYDLDTLIEGISEENRHVESFSAAPVGKEFR